LAFVDERDDGARGSVEEEEATAILVDEKATVKTERPARAAVAEDELGFAAGDRHTEDREPSFDVAAARPRVDAEIDVVVLQRDVSKRSRDPARATEPVKPINEDAPRAGVVRGSHSSSIRGLRARSGSPRAFFAARA